jgi:hypothetical protein
MKSAVRTAASKLLSSSSNTRPSRGISNFSGSPPPPLLAAQLQGHRKQKRRRRDSSNHCCRCRTMRTAVRACRFVQDGISERSSAGMEVGKGGGGRRLLLKEEGRRRSAQGGHTWRRGNEGGKRRPWVAPVTERGGEEARRAQAGREAAARREAGRRQHIRRFERGEKGYGSVRR